MKSLVFRWRLKVSPFDEEMWVADSRDCNPGIPDPGIPDHFSIPKSRDYGRPNPGISGLENSVLTLLLITKLNNAKQLHRWNLLQL